MFELRSTSKRLGLLCLTPVVVCCLNSAVAAPKKALAKNVIVMISDGWGYNHLSAASYYEYGKDARQIYNRFPFNVASRERREETLTVTAAMILGR